MKEEREEDNDGEEVIRRMQMMMGRMRIGRRTTAKRGGRQRAV